ncbi:MULTISPECIES: magnesium transporter [unclassified Dietzia]|uniref:magnesium transporter n=1 Tax=unclassified Dietzia TaxID=2617939 RepID=UPI0015FDC782|nr:MULTISPECIES: magnesium transporter [unclassified Dietzia]MBB1055134.1 magnesium transporter [Dietzia sp. B44]MBB1058615.1 magnesium transporter [Dietzia sp. B19]
MYNNNLVRLVRDNATDQARTWVRGNHAVRVAEELARMDPSDRAVAFRLLDKDKAMSVFELLDAEHQRTLIDGLRDERVHELFAAMSPADRVRLLDEVPAKVATRLQHGLSDTEREATAELLGYWPRTAGRVMIPAAVTLAPGQTREQALDRLGGLGGRSEDYSLLPVTDDERRLVGVVWLSDIVTSEDGTRIEAIMSKEKYSVDAGADQESAARLLQEADLLALPVVDAEQRVIGMIPVDMAMEVLEEEVTRDALRAGGAEPLGVSYLSATVFRLARTRAVWLLALILAAVMTVNVLEYFEDTLATVVTLALFIPLLVDTGGNAGSQAASAMIRALAVNEVRVSDLPRVLWREARVGLLLGLLLAAVGFPVASFFYGVDIGIIISLTLVLICLWASAVGGVLPLIAHKLRIDPAVFSAPVVTTLVDATGLIIYFLIASVVLSDQLEVVTALAGG